MRKSSGGRSPVRKKTAGSGRKNTGPRKASPKGKPSGRTGIEERKSREDGSKPIFKKSERSASKPEQISSDRNRSDEKKSFRPHKPRVSERAVPSSGKRPSSGRTFDPARSDKKFEKKAPSRFSKDRDLKHAETGERAFKPRSNEGANAPVERKPASKYSEYRKSNKPFDTKRTGDAKKTYRGKSAGDDRQKRNDSGQLYDKPRYSSSREKTFKKSSTGGIRLNKFIANSGICSRREADDMITAGVMSINGEIVTELGTKVMHGDVVRYNDRVIKSEKLVYLLLNKPKDFITTKSDPQNRKTVMALVENACRESIYPVGRLDRNTTGLLLFTNDGDMTRKLSHPSSIVPKLYHVTLDIPLSKNHFDAISEGIELEDGFVKADEISYTGTGKKEFGIVLHSGKNRIVRRIFESLGYDVVKLDRVSFAGLTKKDLSRGRWRFLTEKEISFLKMLKVPKDKQ